MFKNALVSVSDKSGLVEFLRPLAEKGLRIVSTGGTAKHLKANGIDVVDVSEQTQFPEVLDGRVKTLHPKIHMALLSRGWIETDQKTLKDYEVEEFDLVIGNLYPFESSLKSGKQGRELIEFIDIGGPSFLRAAAKNFERITVVCDPKDYTLVENGESQPELRKKLAAKVFQHTSHYDALIAQTLDAEFVLSGYEKVQDLRYGENPQQKAIWYKDSLAKSGWHSASKLQGKELSYNNLLDCDAALSTLLEFQQPCCVSVKHNNPCGVAVGSSIEQCVNDSIDADPVSVFGGIVAINRPINQVMAEKLSSLFLECVIAPEVSEEAQNVFSKKKNLRILIWPDMNKVEHQQQIKSIIGGALVQEPDKVQSQWNDKWQVVGAQPSEEVKQAATLAWVTCAHLKSNSIAICNSKQTLGLGMGQVNRVDAVEQAIERYHRFHPQASSPIVLASDAFFPFADSIERCAKAGIQWVIQPGGSIRDEEVLSKAKELKVNMILTEVRHFLH